LGRVRVRLLFMNIVLAMEYIPRRMRELGVGDNYYLRFKHLVLKANEVIELNAYNEYYLLVEDAEDVSIESDTGLFDLSDGNTNELQYEHQGSITITNNAADINHLRFIQIILKHNH